MTRRLYLKVVSCDGLSWHFRSGPILPHISGAEHSPKAPLPPALPRAARRSRSDREPAPQAARVRRPAVQLPRVQDRPPAAETDVHITASFPQNWRRNVHNTYIGLLWMPRAGWTQGFWPSWRHCPATASLLHGSQTAQSLSCTVRFPRS